MVMKCDCEADRVFVFCVLACGRSARSTWHATRWLTRLASLLHTLPTTAQCPSKLPYEARRLASGIFSDNPLPFLWERARKRVRVKDLCKWLEQDNHFYFFLTEPRKASGCVPNVLERPQWFQWPRGWVIFMRATDETCSAFRNSGSCHG